jgi:hypothetical protein
MVEQKARGWKILLPGLVSQAKSQAAEAAASVDHSQQGKARASFDEATFLHHLVNFIVVDDQVCVFQFWFSSTLTVIFP